MGDGCRPDTGIALSAARHGQGPETGWRGQGWHGGRSEKRGPCSRWRSISLRCPRSETNREARRVRRRLRSACVRCRRALRSACVPTQNADQYARRTRSKTRSMPATEVDGTGRRAWFRAARLRRGGRDEPLGCPRNMAPLLLMSTLTTFCRPPPLHSTRARLPPQMARRARPPPQLHGCMQHSTRRRFTACGLLAHYPSTCPPPISFEFPAPLET